MQNMYVSESYDRNNLVNIHPIISMIIHKTAFVSKLNQNTILMVEAKMKQF